jgi:hypothetical protein
VPTNLTGNKIKDTYSQLLHIDGGPAATEKHVLSGTGVVTALSVGTGSISVDNIKIDGNTISSLDTDGNIILAPNGTGVVVISEAEFTTLDAVTFNTVNIAAGMRIDNATIVAQGTDTNISITLTPKGTGSVVLPKVDITDGTVPFNTITNRAFASFFDAGTTDQVGSTTDRTAVKWATAAVTGAGITVASNSRITLAAAGTYRINASLQFHNSTNTTRTVDFWFAKNGTNIANSAARITVPANNAGGTYLAAYEIFETVAANDYIEMYWYPSDTSATLHYIAPVTANPGVTPAIPAVPPAIVVVERIA